MLLLLLNPYWSGDVSNLKRTGSFSSSVPYKRKFWFKRLSKLPNLRYLTKWVSPKIAAHASTIGDAAATCSSVILSPASFLNWRKEDSLFVELKLYVVVSSASNT